MPRNRIKGIRPRSESMSRKRLVKSKPDKSKTATTTIEQREIDQIEIARLDKEFPLIPHTRSSRAFSTVQRMKAEKERNIPIEHRAGFVISVETGKRANKMTKREWESFYGALCKELKTDHPDLYARLFRV